MDRVVYMTDTYFLTELEARKPTIMVLVCWVLVRVLVLAGRWLPSDCVLTWWREKALCPFLFS